MLYLVNDIHEKRIAERGPKTDHNGPPPTFTPSCYKCVSKPQDPLN